MGFIILPALAMAAAALPPRPAGLPPYAAALRCAALSQAANASVKDKSGPDAAMRYDHLIFWSLAASEAARHDGIKAARFEEELKQSADAAAPELSASADARAELERCDAQVPPLKS